MTIVDPPTPSDSRGRTQWRYRAGLATLGVIVVGIAGVGLWYSSEYSKPAGSDTLSGTQDPPILGLQRFVSPRVVPDIAFQDVQGGKHTFAEFRGKAVLLNIWATWCAPCRKEMPTLDRLQSKLGSDHFQVVALSIDRDGVSAVKSFYDEIGIRALAIYVDPTMDAQAKLGIVGVPTTLLVDREGREIARYTGPAEWDHADVVAMVQRYLPPRTP